ncbi:major facilitator superfamily domain-containing protein [Zopfochytrium polystomum]|nr:major facilitator superfamily domain-containing protein [Zopfochytrium polystomum]
MSGDSDERLPAQYSQEVKKLDTEDVPVDEDQAFIDECEKDPGYRNRVLRKMDFRTLPLLALAYFLSYLDRSNAGNAKAVGIQKDLGISDPQWNWAISIFYFGYVAFDLPFNIILRRWKPSKLMAILMVLWGIVSTAMAASKNFASFASMRFLSGVFEAGLFPGVVYYLSLFYQRREQGRRIGAFWSIASVSGAVGGTIASAITASPATSLKEWQVLFIVEGVPNFFVAAAIWFLLPDSPEAATFFTDEERRYVITRLKLDAGAAHDHSFSWPQIFSVMTDYKTYIYAIIYITGTSSLQGVTYFLPSIITGLNPSYSNYVVQALTVPAYTLAFFATVGTAFSSDRLGERSLHMICVNLVGMTGFLLLMYGSGFGATYTGALLATASVYANVSIKVAWFNNNYGGLTRRAAAAGVIVSIGTIGGAIGGQIYFDKWNNYFGGHTIAISCIAAQTALVILLRFVFVNVNKRRSLMDEAEKNAVVEKYGGVELAGDRMPDFRYTL